jgi:hypothetical protein
MSAWLGPDDVVTGNDAAEGIFPVNLLCNEELYIIFQSLAVESAGIDGKAYVKPFECVGTAIEAVVCVELAIPRYLDHLVRSGVSTGSMTAERMTDIVEKLPVCLRNLINELRLHPARILENWSIYSGGGGEEALWRKLALEHHLSMPSNS